MWTGVYGELVLFLTDSEMRQCIQPGTFKQTHPPDYMVQTWRISEGERTRPGSNIYFSSKGWAV